MAKLSPKAAKSPPNPIIPDPIIPDPISPNPIEPKPIIPDPFPPKELKPIIPDPLPPNPEFPNPTDPTPQAHPSPLNSKPLSDVALKRGYLIQNKLLNRFVSLCDWTLERTLSRLIVQGREIKPPKRLLIANFAHLGDAILTTSVLAPLKASFPDLEIGVLIGSWSRPIFEKHPLVSHIHLIDHPFLVRAKTSLLRKSTQYLIEEMRVLSELSRVGYDTAVDLRFHFPSSASLLVRSKIPVRLGFKTAGFAPLLTHPVAWSSPTSLQNNWSTVDYFKDILSHLPGATFPDQLKPSLPCQDPQGFDSIYKRFGLHKKEYLVIHMGSGSPIKSWPKEKWSALAKRLVERGEKLVFTGKGALESQDIIEVTRPIKDQIVNLADQLSWEELVCLITHTKGLIAVDTSAGHIAAAVDTPALLLFTGIYPPSLWAPPSSCVQVLTHPVACAPCYQGRGCSSMACLKNLEIDKVFEEALKLFSPSSKRSSL